MSPTRKPPAPPGMGIAEIAELCHVSTPNVRKMIARYDIEPWFELKIGKVYRREDIERMQAERMSNLTARAADEKRRLNARR